MHRMADNIIAQVINLDGSPCVQPPAHSLALDPVSEGEPAGCHAHTEHGWRRQILQHCQPSHPAVKPQSLGSSVQQQRTTVDRRRSLTWYLENKSIYFSSTTTDPKKIMFSL